MSVPKPPALLTFGRWPLWIRVVLSMTSGVLMSLAFAPADVRFAAWVALVPLLLALRGATARAGLVAGVAFGLSFFGILIAWISLVGWMAWGALVALQILFVAVFGLLAAPLSRGGPVARIAGLPMLFTGIELLRTRYPLGGFGFGTFGSSQHSGLPMLPLARVGGVFAVTFALVAVNALLAEAVGSRRRTGRLVWTLVAVALVAAPAALPLGAVAYSDADPVDVAIVQGNVPRGYFSGVRFGRVGPEDQVIIDNHLRLTLTLASDRPDLIIWPENALDRDPFTDPAAQTAIAEALAAVETPLLVGAIVDAPRRGRFYNANILFEPGGAIAGRYDKMRLVPFGEYVPWSWARDVIPALGQIPTDGIPGEKEHVLQTGDLPPIGAVICFESADPGHVRRFVAIGAEILVVSTNNATFERSPLARQHLAQSRMRAVELGRPVLHSAIAGISAVIEPDGTITQQAGLFVPAILRQQIRAATGLTPWAAYGDALTLAYLAAAALAAVVALLIAAKRRIPGLVPDDDDDEFWGLAHGEPIAVDQLRSDPAVADVPALESPPVAPRPGGEWGREPGS